MTDVTEATRSTPGSEATSADHGSIIWYEVMTPDPDGAKAFYDSVVGWDIEPEPSGEMDYRMIRRSDGGNAGGVLRITPEMASQGARPGWLCYIDVDDVDRCVASVEQAGGTSLMTSDIAGVGRIALVTDPQGAPFYVMKPIPPENDPNAKSDVFSPNAEQRVGWNELATRDQDAALDFYTRQFGWEAGDSMPMGDMGRYQFINRGGVMLGAIMTASPERPVRWRFYFRVPNTDEAAERVKAGGGTVMHGPVEVPGGDRILIATDPQGAEFALVGAQ